LLDLGEQYGVDEFVVLTVVYDFNARMKSYELLAKEFELAGISAPHRVSSSP